MLATLVGVLSLIATACMPPGAELGLESAPTVLVGNREVSVGGPNRAPRIIVPDRTVAYVGATMTTKIGIVDPDGDSVTLSYGELPPGLTVDGSVMRFRPRTPGSWQFEVTATDRRGATSRRVVPVAGRYPSQPRTIVALGDSVASGHGLEIFDYLGGDSCWRSTAAYPHRVFGALYDDGRFDRLVNASCSGHRTSDLFTVPVQDEEDQRSSRGGGSVYRTQVEWAIATNPGLVTLTVGANDIRFNQPHDLIIDGALDTATMSEHLDTFESDLARLVEQLVLETDSLILLTTYYNPTAVIPNGVPGCRGDCFVAVTDQVLAALNSTIVAVANRYSVDRVVVADPSPLFEGHGAPNGWGPDSIRDGDGLLGSILGEYTEGVHPYCSKPRTSHEAWVNSIDCVHPNANGSAAYAATIVDRFRSATR